MKRVLIFLLPLLISIFVPFSISAQSDNKPFIYISKPEIGEFFEIQSDVILSGTATPNSDITILTKEGEYAKLKSDAEGTWSYTIPTVSEGNTTIQARVDVEIDELSSESTTASVTYIVGPPPSNTASVARLAETGAVTGFLVISGLLLISLTLWSVIDYRRHKRPLKQANEKVNYSFWHHLKVVSIPLLKYRLSINLYKRAPSKSERVRRY